MELWDLYNWDRQPTGQTMERGFVYPQGGMHLVVHILVFNERNEMLIQRRQPFKSGWSGMWDLSAEGSAVAGENSRQAAHRELLEELGMDRDFSSLRPHFTINYEHGFDDYYLIEENDLDLNSLHLQETQVAEVRWASKGEILQLIRDDLMIPYFEPIVELSFAVRKQFNGSHAVTWQDYRDAHRRSE